MHLLTFITDSPQVPIQFVYRASAQTSVEISGAGAAATVYALQIEEDPSTSANIDPVVERIAAEIRGGGPPAGPRDQFLRMLGSIPFEGTCYFLEGIDDIYMNGD